MKMKIFILTILIFVLIQQTTSGVMQITHNNLKNVLSTYEQIYVLFHNPQCIHSRKYVQTFLKADTQYKLGVVDCLRQLQLCTKYNLTNFPVLAKINIQDQTQIVDEQQFLVQHKLKSQNSDEVMVNRFTRYLDLQPFYAVVVFEDFELPAQKSQKILQKDQRVFYLQPFSQSNPSNFTKLLSSLVHNQQGCWIFKKESGQLQKFHCESGYNKNITHKYIDLFKKNKLKRHVFSEQKLDEAKNKLKAVNLYQILDRFGRFTDDVCAVIYMSSSNCPSCDQKDVQNTIKVLKNLNLEGQIVVYKYSIDQNQIPHKLFNLGFKRIPELIYICKGSVKIFGQVFFINNIRQFIRKSHLEPTQQAAIRHQKKGKEANQKSVEEKLQF